MRYPTPGTVAISQGSPRRLRSAETVMRKRLGEPWIIATVAGAGYRIDTLPDTAREEGDRG